MDSKSCYIPLSSAGLPFSAVKFPGLTLGLLEDSSQCPPCYQVFILWKAETQTTPSLVQALKMFSYCFPVVLSLVLSTFCNVFQIRTLPKTQGKPSANLQNADMLECTLQHVFTPLPPRSLVSDIPPCNSNHLGLPKLLSLFPNLNKTGSFWFFHFALQPVNNLSTTSRLHCKLVQ